MKSETAEDYYSTLSRMLRISGGGVPRLLIDLEALDANIRLLKSLRTPDQIRLVAKSLPSPGLIEYISQGLWDTSKPKRLMVFHLPFLLQLSQRYPDADILLGKPLPISAMARFPEPGSRRLQWLVDDERRLRQVIDLGQSRSERLGVTLELDVGMHRGGVGNPSELRKLLDVIRSHRDEVELRGFMGYDAHASKAPPPLSVQRACERSAAVYRGLLELARAEFPDLEERSWCINGAGSPTFTEHGAASPLTDISLGSVLLKPAGFDLPQLQEFRPAALIGTPVLKRLKGVNIPFLEKLPGKRRDTLFVYGGRWMATPEWPPGLKASALYGLSSNQQLFTIPSKRALEADDHVFLRPDQSEAVLLQFGDLLAFRGDEAIDEWPVLKNELSSLPSAQTAMRRNSPEGHE